MRWDSAISFAIFYSVIAIICFLSGAFDIERKQNKKFLICFFTVIFFLAAFRDYSVGNDTKVYVNIFKSISKQKDIIRYMQSSDYESLYVFLNWIISRFTDNPRFLFVIIAVICGLSICSFAYKYVQNIGTFCCLFFVMQFSFYTSIMRQALSIACILAAYRFLDERKWIRFFIFTLCAIGFHNSAWLFVCICPFLSFTKDKRKVLYSSLIAVTLCCIIFSNQMLALAVKLFPKYSYYEDGAYFDGEPRLATFLNFMIYALLLIVPKCFMQKECNKRSENTSIEDCATVVPFVYLITSIATALSRFSAIFTIFAITNYSNKIILIDKKQRVIVNIITLIAFFAYGFTIALLKTPEWQTTYPFILNFDI